jgi:hypothetical protein
MSKPMDIDLPDVVAEVTAAFERYERALMANDVATLNSLFRDDQRTIRYGGGENLYGHAAISSFAPRARRSAWRAPCRRRSSRPMGAMRPSPRHCFTAPLPQARGAARCRPGSGLRTAGASWRRM